MLPVRFRYVLGEAHGVGRLDLVANHPEDVPGLEHAVHACLEGGAAGADEAPQEWAVVPEQVDSDLEEELVGRLHDLEVLVLWGVMGEGGRNGERGGKEGERDGGSEGGREGGREGCSEGEREGGREEGWWGGREEGRREEVTHRLSFFIALSYAVKIENRVAVTSTAAMLQAVLRALSLLRSDATSREIFKGLQQLVLEPVLLRINLCLLFGRRPSLRHLRDRATRERERERGVKVAEDMGCCEPSSPL